MAVAVSPAGKVSVIVTVPDVAAVPLFVTVIGVASGAAVGAGTLIGLTRAVTGSPVPSIPAVMAGLIIAVAMLRSDVFIKATALLGIILNSMMLVPPDELRALG